VLTAIYIIIKYSFKLILRLAASATCFCSAFSAITLQVLVPYEMGKCNKLRGCFCRSFVLVNI